MSQQLATIERGAGVALLERIGRRVRLTAEGARLVPDAEIILRAVEAAELDLRAAGEKPAEAVAVRTPGGPPLSQRVHALTRGALTASPLVRALLSELESTPECAASIGHV